MKFKISDLPGIGKRHSLVTAKGQEIVIITHHHGRREIYYFESPDDDEPILDIELSDEEARQTGAILLGVDYQPVPEEKMEMMLESIRVHWMKVPEGSCMANRSIKETEIRKKTGATIIGIKRDGQIKVSPDVEEKILVGDVLMVIGKKDPLKELENMCNIRL